MVLGPDILAEHNKRGKRDIVQLDNYKLEEEVVVALLHYQH